MQVRGSLRSELISLTLVIALTFIGLLLLTTYFEVQEERRRAQESTLTLAQLTAAHTEQLLADSETLLAQIAQRPLVQAMDPTQCDPSLADFAALMPQFVGLGLINAEGEVLCSPSAEPGAPPTSVVDREWFQRVKESEEFTVGRVQVGRVSGRWVSALAYPVINEAGDFVGALSLPIDLVRYQAGLTGVTLPPDTTIAIIDDQGNVVARSSEPEEWIGRNVRGAEVVDIVLAEGEGFATAEGTDGIQKIYGFIPIPRAGWYVYSGIPTEVAFARVETILLRDGVLLLTFAALVIALFYYLRRQVVRPVTELAQVAQAVAQGQLDRRGQLSGPKELSEVTRQFNEMLDARASHTRQLQQIAETPLSLNPLLSPAEILQLALKEARQIIQAHVCLALISDAQDMEMPAAILSVSDAYQTWQNHTGLEAMGRQLSRPAIESNRPLCLSQGKLTAQPAWAALAAEAAGLPPLNGWLAAPLTLSSNRRIGVIALSAKQVGDFSADDEAILWQLAQLTSVALENALLFHSLNEQSEQMRGLALRLAEAEEMERRRLARELHDGVGQLLTALNIDLYMLQSEFAADASTRERLQTAVEMVKEALDRTRDVLTELRPTTLEENGLGKALRWYGDQFSQRTGIAVQVKDQESGRRLLPNVEMALFRVAQEALTNIVKHAEARQVEITLTSQDSHFNLIICDDGKGFDLPALRRSRQENDARPSWGLINMRERAEAVRGHFQIESQPGDGTQITVQVPL